jgi:hypothetical protein
MLENSTIMTATSNTKNYVMPVAGNDFGAGPNKS